VEEGGWVRLTGTVRFGHFWKGACVARANAGVLVPTKVESIAAPPGAR
jgi:hypothetical protein